MFCDRILDILGIVLLEPESYFHVLFCQTATMRGHGGCQLMSSFIGMSQKVQCLGEKSGSEEGEDKMVGNSQRRAPRD